MIVVSTGVQDANPFRGRGCKDKRRDIVLTGRQTRRPSTAVVTDLRPVEKIPDSSTERVGYPSARTVNSPRSSGIEDSAARILRQRDTPARYLRDSDLILANENRRKSKKSFTVWALTHPVRIPATDIELKRGRLRNRAKLRPIEDQRGRI
ncbi:hypothetical protein B0H19DRAFT_1076627 [Mycena capillaripes]|nr:hypothetical protein B0H19DRAFT_1076627 [Mycena capillaripes]